METTMYWGFLRIIGYLLGLSRGNGCDARPFDPFIRPPLSTPVVRFSSSYK